MIQTSNSSGSNLFSSWTYLSKWEPFKNYLILMILGSKLDLSASSENQKRNFEKSDESIYMEYRIST